LISSSSLGQPPQDSVALAFQMRAIPKSALQTKIWDLDESELEELELATDEALGRVEPNWLRVTAESGRPFASLFFRHRALAWFRLRPGSLAFSIEQRP
jgi:hypothetical protein